MKLPSYPLAVAVGAFLLSAGPIIAMPNFAKKYDVDCNMCHTTIPRLNEFGLDFRKSGFRNSDEIGKDANTSFKDTFAARIQMRYDYKSRDNAGTTTTTNQLTFKEITLYPLTGSFGEHFGSLMEISFANEDFVEIENAYFRYVTGDENGWFSARVGIFHPFEGYGASDRPYTLSRPFIQGNPANHNGSTYFKPWGFDQSGINVAYIKGHTTVSATIFNGIYVEDDGGAYKAFPAAGGHLQKMDGFGSKNSKDFQIVLTQALKDDGSGLTLYYYNGRTDLPIPGTASSAFAPATSWDNQFSRLAFYGSYRVAPKVDLQAGYQTGQDHYYDTVSGSTSGTFNSNGYFGEVDVDINDHMTCGVRYDSFDPSDKKGSNEKTGFTLFANMPMNNGLQTILEYQHVQQKRGAVADLEDNNFQARLIWIW